MNINWIEVFGYAGAFLTLGTFAMTKMIPLRIIGIGANFAFISYGALAPIYPVLALHAILLPAQRASASIRCCNSYGKVREASQGDLNFDWLKPFMSRARMQGWRDDFPQRRPRVRNVLHSLGTVPVV